MLHIWHKNYVGRKYEVFYISGGFFSTLINFRLTQLVWVQILCIVSYHKVTNQRLMGEHQSCVCVHNKWKHVMRVYSDIYYGMLNTTNILYMYTFLPSISIFIILMRNSPVMCRMLIVHGTPYLVMECCN